MERIIKHNCEAQSLDSIACCDDAPQSRQRKNNEDSQTNV